MTDIKIPPEVVEAAKLAWANGTGPTSADDWEAAYKAGLRAWPGVNTEQREVLNFGNNIDGPIISAKRLPFLILPLPKEDDDE